MNQYPPPPNPQWPPQEPQQPATPPGWQPAPPSYVGQQPYGTPTPTPTPAPGAPYGQYAPPNPYPPQPQPPQQPFGQYGQPSQYPGQAYGQYAPPSQYPQQTPYSGYQPPPVYTPPSSSNGQRNTLLAVGAGIVAIALIAFFVLKGSGGSASLTGTWVGPAVATDSSSSANLQYGAMLTLNESSGGQVTGTAVSCDSSSTSSNSANVSGTHSGSSVSLRIDGVTYSGQISGGKLTLSASQNSASVTMTLHQGSTNDFHSICGGLPTPTS